MHPQNNIVQVTIWQFSFVLLNAVFLSLAFASPNSSSPSLKFEDYSVQGETGVKPHRLDTHGEPKARTYRSVLNGALSEGINFAGQFRIASWGCGTSCRGHAIVNIKTGKPYFPKEIETTGEFQPCSRDLLEFHRDSTLLSVTQIDRDTAITMFYEWRVPKLVRLDERRHSVDEFCQGH